MFRMLESAKSLLAGIYLIAYPGQDLHRYGGGRRHASSLGEHHWQIRAQCLQETKRLKTRK